LRVREPYRNEGEPSSYDECRWTSRLAVVLGSLGATLRRQPEVRHVLDCGREALACLSALGPRTNEIPAMCGGPSLGEAPHAN